MFEIADSSTSRSSQKPFKSEQAAAFADIVVAELVSRMALFRGPDQPVLIQFDLGNQRRRFGYTIKASRAGGTMARGWVKHPLVTVRQDLLELIQLVFGRERPPRIGTREVFIGEPPVKKVRAMESWNKKSDFVAVAVTQVLEACAGYRGALANLAVQFGSDKWGGHWYAPLYERHFGPFRESRVKILEIGIGGYQCSSAGGASLRMWKHFFRRGFVYGVDVFDKSKIDAPRLRTFRGNQSDVKFLDRLGRNIGPFDVIVDDGSHLSPDVIGTFHSLFPYLRPGGIYVIEDLQTSYWPGWKGDSNNLNSPKTAIGFLKTLVDGLHHQERLNFYGYRPSFSDMAVNALHFYHNIAFIEKGLNTEQSAPAWISRTESPYL